MMFRVRISLSWLLPFFILTLFFVGQFLALKNHSQSFYFQDETEHVVPGWLIVERGQALYQDFSTNHQPLPMLFSVPLMQFISFGTLFQLVERVRVSMLLFSVAISLYAVLRFRWKGLLSSIFTQSLAFYYFGFHVLAESLVAPFVMVLVLFLLEQTFEKNKLSQKQLLLDNVVVGFSVFWVGLNLVPLWPFLALFSLFWLYKNNFWERIYFLSAGLLPIAVTLSLFPTDLWIKETFIHLIQYYLPYHPSPTLVNYFGILSFPILSLAYLSSDTARFLLVGFLVIMTIFYLLYKKKKRFWIKLFFIYILIMVLNNRVVTPNKVFYDGFHLYPMMAGFSALVGYFMVIGWQKINNGLAKMILVVVALLILINNLSWWFEQKDKMTEHYVQYGTQQAIANAILTIKDEDDRLLTGADGFGYINIMADIPLADRQNFHLDWAYRVPELREEFEQMVANNPPEFVYFTPPFSSNYYEALNLDENYIEFSRDGEQNTDFFVHKQKVLEISPDQMQKLNEQIFEIP